MAAQYSADDLVVRRAALGLSLKQLGALVGRSYGHLSDAERGVRPVTAALIDRIAVVEQWVEAQVAELLPTLPGEQAAELSDPLMLQRLSEAQFRQAYPGAATEFGPIPVVLYDVVLGRVAAQYPGPVVVAPPEK